MIFFGGEGIGGGGEEGERDARTAVSRESRHEFDSRLVWVHQVWHSETVEDVQTEWLLRLFDTFELFLER